MPSRFAHEESRQRSRSAATFKARLKYILPQELMDEYCQLITDAHLAGCEHLIATAARRLVRARKWRRQAIHLRGKLDRQYRITKAQYTYIQAQREILKKNKLLVNPKEFFKEL